MASLWLVSRDWAEETENTTFKKPGDSYIFNAVRENQINCVQTQDDGNFCTITPFLMSL
jgi:hypothetical protein